MPSISNQIVIFFTSFPFFCNNFIIFFAFCQSAYYTNFVLRSCAYCLSGQRSSGSCFEPLDHLAGLFTATDFHRSAVLFALALGTTEHIHELLKLGNVHHIDGVVLGDVGESVAMRGSLVQLPNIVKVGLALAHIARHERKGGSLDRDVHAVGAYVGAGAVVGAVVMHSVDAHIGAEVMLASDARVARGGSVIDGKSCHFWGLPSLNFCIQYTIYRARCQAFFAKKQEIFCLSFVTYL